MTCTFDRVKVMRGKEQIYDLNPPYHVVLVRGQVDKNNRKRPYVPEPFKDPWISPDQVSMSDNVDITGRARYPLVKAHGKALSAAPRGLVTSMDMHSVLIEGPSK